MSFTENHGSMKKILIIDDEEAVLFAYKKLLRRYKLELELCETFDNAIKKIKSNIYDTVISDIRLSGTDTEAGINILRYIKILKPDTKMILITGFGDNITRNKSFELGVNYYFEKPISPFLLVEALRSLNVIGSSE